MAADFSTVLDEMSPTRRKLLLDLSTDDGIGSLTFAEPGLR